MTLRRIDQDFTVCKVASEEDLSLEKEFYFIGKTDEEISLVCLTEDIPHCTIDREDGWKAFRIQGVLDFTLIGILSGISSILADHKIGIFVVSTFNTDYVLVKREEYENALCVLADAGYSVV